MDKLTEVELYNQAQDLHKKKEYGLAAEFFEHYEIKFPINANICDATFSRAECYYRACEYEKAVATFETFIDKYPTDVRAAQCYRYIFFCYFNQVTRYDRDGRVLEQAFKWGAAYKDFYIEDDQFVQAYKRIQDYSVFCKLKSVHDSLDQDPKLWSGALWSASALMKEDASNPISAEAYYRVLELFLAQKSDSLKKDAVKIFSAMAKNHSESEWYKKASALIEKECAAEGCIEDIDEE